MKTDIKKNQSVGIIHSSESGYVCAQLQLRKNIWALKKIRRYPTEKSIGQLPLLKSRVFLGMPSQWQVTDRVDEQKWICAANVTTPMTPTASAVELGMHVNRLQLNLAGISVDDMFLTTIPLQSSELKTDSFISVYQSAEKYLIGITWKKQLSCVFKFALDEIPVSSHIGRIQRFWSMKTGLEYPQNVCFIGEVHAELPQNGVVVAVKQWGNDEEELRASGLALANTIEEYAPLLHGQTISAKMLRIRNIAAIAAAAMVILSVLSLLIPMGLTAHYESKVTQYKNEYQQILRNNIEVKKGFDYNKKLAGRIITLQTLFTRQTAWSRLLAVLAQSRPNGLYLDKLGSREDNGSHSTELAFSGWAPSESAVTQFISTLSKENYISNIQLSSIERDAKTKSITRFKIHCLLHEIKQ